MSWQPTNLYPLRNDVKRENETEFEKLKEKAYVFTCRDEHSGPEVDRKRSLERVRLPCPRLLSS